MPKTITLTETQATALLAHLDENRHECIRRNGVDRSGRDFRDQPLLLDPEDIAKYDPDGAGNWDDTVPYVITQILKEQLGQPLDDEMRTYAVIRFDQQTGMGTAAIFHNLDKAKANANERLQQGFDVRIYCSEPDLGIPLFELDAS